MDARIEKVLNHVASHLSAPTNLSKLAKLACLSASHFHSVFKQATGYTPFKFIEKMRLNFAYQKLMTAPQNIQQLSVQCGYQDYETFSRAFKRQYCLSPDDLAAISLNVKQKNDSSESIYIAALADYDISAMQNKFDELVDELQLNQHQLEGSTVYLVEQVDGVDAVASVQLVKNKYRIVEDEDLWQLLIKRQ